LPHSIYGTSSDSIGYSIDVTPIFCIVRGFIFIRIVTIAPVVPVIPAVPISPFWEDGKDFSFLAVMPQACHIVPQTCGDTVAMRSGRKPAGDFLLSPLPLGEG